MNGQPPGRVTADTPEQGRQLVRERKQQGADLIKVYSGLRVLRDWTRIGAVCW
jgi:hypothetical protein